MIISRGPVLIDSGPQAADRYTTGNLEFAFVWGPVAVQAEAFRSSVKPNDSGSGDASGAYAHISYFLTAGFNWYWSDRTRWMFDWIQPVTSEQTTFGATHSDLLAIRFDFNG